jgi:hypothetical protein
MFCQTSGLLLGVPPNIHCRIKKQGENTTIGREKNWFYQANRRTNHFAKQKITIGSFLRRHMNYS